MGRKASTSNGCCKTFPTRWLRPAKVACLKCRQDTTMFLRKLRQRLKRLGRHHHTFRRAGVRSCSLLCFKQLFNLKRHSTISTFLSFLLQGLSNTQKTGNQTSPALAPRNRKMKTQANAPGMYCDGRDSCKQGTTCM